MIWFYVGVVVILFVLYLIIQNTVKGKLMLAFQKNDFETYYMLLDKTITKICIPIYNIEYMRLNGFIQEKRHKKVEEQLELLFKANKNKEQKENLVQKSLQYYVDKEDSKSCHTLLNYMKEIKLEEQSIREATYVVDILVDHKTNWIEEIEQKLETCSQEQKPTYYFLLKVQYENLNNREMAKKYESLLTQN